MQKIQEKRKTEYDGKSKQKRKMKEEEKIQSEINSLFYSIMDGYSDKVIAPLSEFSPSMEQETDATAAIVEEKDSSSGKRGRTNEVPESSRKERDRRKMTSKSYDLLLSLVPNLLPKAAREKILGETIAYIQALEKEINKLEEQKSESRVAAKRKKTMEQYSNRDSSINVSISNNFVAFFGIQSLVRPNLLTDIFTVFHNHKAEVLAANVAVNDQRQLNLTVTAAIVDSNGNTTIEKIKTDILILTGIENC